MKMSVVLSNKAVKLLKLCEVEDFKNFDDLSGIKTMEKCPAICMTEGCDHTAYAEPDQDQGICEACGAATVASALVLAGLI
jgi:hypothetical protein